MASYITEDFIEPEAELRYLIAKEYGSAEFFSQRSHLHESNAPVLTQPLHQTKNVVEVTDLYYQFWEAEEIIWNKKYIIENI